MGLAFTLRNANLVAHLVDRKPARFLDELAFDPDAFDNNVEFIRNFVTEDPRQLGGTNVFLTTRDFHRKIEPQLIWLRRKWEELEASWKRTSRWDYDPYLRQERLNFLTLLGEILARCTVKALLLPGFSDNRLSRSLRGRALIERLVDIHPGSSALILQITDPLGDADKTVFNVFEKFDRAYERIDEWPGVLIWDRRISVFVPVRSDEDVLQLFARLRDNRTAFMRENSAVTKENKYVYLFHISDLHFGSSLSTLRVRRLKTILRNRLNSLTDCLAAIPIITGDIQNSPRVTTEEKFGDFCDALRDYGFEDPIIVPGNHDERLIGLSPQLALNPETYGVSNRPIETFPEMKLQFLRFDSNISGIAASGGIGEQQLIDIGGRLDRSSNNDLFTIALLHHHPISIDDPAWYRQAFYERLLTDRGRVITQRLNDAERFLEWLRERQVTFVLHGHKHIPMIQTDETGTIEVIGAGSSTGKIHHQDWRRTYLSYNILKFDPDQRKMISCTIIAEEVIGGGTKDIQIKTY
jgi:hypothetical protein